MWKFWWGTSTRNWKSRWRRQKRDSKQLEEAAIQLAGCFVWETSEAASERVIAHHHHGVSRKKKVAPAVTQWTANLHTAGSRKSTPVFKPVPKQSVLPLKTLQQEFWMPETRLSWPAGLFSLYSSTLKKTSIQRGSVCRTWRRRVTTSGSVASESNQIVSYWRPLEPNNATASWDNSRAEQDCVATVPLRRTEQEDWLNLWDELVCVVSNRNSWYS